MRTLSRIFIAALMVPAATDAWAGEPFPTPNVERLATLHAEGAQIYECRTDKAGNLSWQFREPIASLVDGAKTVGRHYAGPSWELTDGTVVKANPVAQAPGATASDIPELMLSVFASKGTGQIAFARTIQRINTKGGVARGGCEMAGSLLSVPYSADYVFLDAVRDN
jgi:hypothetical protein